MPLSEEQIRSVRMALVRTAGGDDNEDIQRLADAVLEIAANEAEHSSDHMSYTRDHAAAKRAATMIRRLKGGGGE